MIKFTVDYYRKNAGMTQAELAEKMFMQRPALNLKLHGKSTFNTSEILRCGEIFKLSDQEIVQMIKAEISQYKGR